MLVTPPYRVNYIVQAVADMEGIDTDLCIGEILLCDRDEPIAHVTGKIVYRTSFFDWELLEVFMQVDT